MYVAQLDEVSLGRLGRRSRAPRRVHQEALDTLTLGSQITELRRLAACNTRPRHAKELGRSEAL